MNYACHHELFPKRLQIFIPKRASLCATFRKGPVGPWAKAMFCCCCCCYQYISWSIFKCVRNFSVLTFGLLGKTSGLHHPVAVIREFSDLNTRFFEKHGLESKQQFPLDYYKWMLILIPFNPGTSFLLVCFGLDSSLIAVSQWLLEFAFHKNVTRQSSSSPQ